MTATEKTVLHSFAADMGQGRLHAPSAERNAGPIAKALAGLMPAQGVVLEVASGTGQHAVVLSAAFPGVTWQPSEVDPVRLASIEAWRAEAGLDNIRAPIRLDATAPDWGLGFVPAVIYLANLMHLLSKARAAAVIAGAARELAPGGRFFVYGPFRVEGAFRSDGDRAFHDRLSKADPEMGYKDLEWIEAQAGESGLTRHALIEMPANNLLIAFERS